MVINTARNNGVNGMNSNQWFNQFQSDALVVCTELHRVGELDRSEIEMITNRSKAAALRLIKWMVKEGLIVKFDKTVKLV